MLPLSSTKAVLRERSQSCSKSVSAYRMHSVLVTCLQLEQVSQLWRERVTAIGAEYPDVNLTHMYVDNAAMQLIRNPKQVNSLFP